MKKTIALVLVIATLVCMFCACGGKQSLIGNWTYSDNGIEYAGLEFTDKKVTVRAAGISMGTFDYKDNGDGTLTVNEGVDVTWTYEFKDGKLNINNGVSTTTYTKK